VRQQPASFYILAAHIPAEPKLAHSQLCYQPATRIKELFRRSPCCRLQVVQHQRQPAKVEIQLSPFSQLALTLRTPRNIGPGLNFRNKAFFSLPKLLSPGWGNAQQRWNDAI